MKRYAGRVYDIQTTVFICRVQMRLPATLHIKGQWREKDCSEVGWRVGLIFTNERVITY